jgi:hypothetical protein
VTTKSKASRSAGAKQHPSLPASAVAAAGSWTGKSTIVRAGKVQPAKHPSRERERAHFYELFVNQLLNATHEQAKKLRSLDAKGAIPSSIRPFLSHIYSETILTIKAHSQHEKIGAPKTLSEAQKLANEAIATEAAIRNAMPKRQQHRKALVACIDDLIGDIRHYARQIELTYHSVPDDGGKPRLANRPTNLDAKQTFAELIFQHQRLHGPCAFPKTGQIRTVLKTAGINVSDRTIRYWIAQMKSGTFDYFVQP